MKTEEEKYKARMEKRLATRIKNIENKYHCFCGAEILNTNQYILKHNKTKIHTDFIVRNDIF